MSSNDEINNVLADALKIIHKNISESEYKMEIECWLHKDKGYEEINPIPMLFENHTNIPNEIWNKLLDLADADNNFLSKLGDGLVEFYDTFDPEIKKKIFELTKKNPEMHEMLLSNTESD